MRKGILVLLLISLLILSGCHQDYNGSTQEENDLNSEITSGKVEEEITSGKVEDEITSGKVEYEYQEGIYPLKMWQVSPPLESEETFSDSITEEKAIAIACAAFEKIQKTGIGKDYVLRRLFYDTEDNVWIVYFSSEPLVPGACYNVAISKDNGEVLNMWPGE